MFLGSEIQKSYCLFIKRNISERSKSWRRKNKLYPGNDSERMDLYEKVLDNIEYTMIFFSILLCYDILMVYLLALYEKG